MKRYFIFFIVFFCIVTAYIAGCASKQPAPENREALKAEKAELEMYYPLAIDNEWTYRGEYLGKKVERTIKIIKQEEGVFIDSGGGKLRFDSRGLRDDKRYLLKVPLHETNKWVSIPSPVAAEQYRYERIHFSDTVPAGTFEDCVSVESSIDVDQSQRMTNIVTYAKGIGIIRINTVLYDSGKKLPQMKVELVSYKVGDKVLKTPAGAENEQEEQAPQEKNNPAGQMGK